MTQSQSLVVSLRNRLIVRQKLELAGGGHCVSGATQIPGTILQRSGARPCPQWPTLPPASTCNLALHRLLLLIMRTHLGYVYIDINSFSFFKYFNYHPSIAPLTKCVFNISKIDGKYLFGYI